MTGMIQVSQQLLDIVVRTERELSRLSDVQTSASPKDGGWSRRQVLGHLIDSASNNHQRFVRGMLSDEFRGPAYDQNGCVRVERFQEYNWSDLVGFWASYNRFLAHILAGVPEEKRKTPCFVGNYPVMTLEELAIDYVRHMQHHLDQIGTHA